MNTTPPHFGALFAQLGLPDDDESIAAFLVKHRSMARNMRLPDAPYWSASQASFLREALTQDAEWAVVVDQLSKALEDPEVTEQTRSLDDS
ncbi:DUF2789 domain-containing protein [Rhodoferax antarcticus]|uniref:DUF2789 domain-containing protein n=1 Tax=Rhodoferax antarcticus TaxID=81479 RepID=UPI002225767C|nr:DUF2789 domain-containing protein [Rhodoferax antarcticus]MCW2311625.1 hypothetical protein [Rhodoferax antarcticus]